MNKKILLTIIFSFIIISFTSAYSASVKRKIYAKAAGGIVFFQSFNNQCENCTYKGKLDNSYSISVASGYDFLPNLSGEILGRFSRSKWKHNESGSSTSQKIKFYSIFANIYLKYPITKHVVPYLILGPGYTFNKSKNIYSTLSGSSVTAPGKNSNSLIWNIGIGNIMKLNNNFSLGLDYRYMYLGKIGYKNFTVGTSSTYKSKHINAHDILISLTYKFY